MQTTDTSQTPALPVVMSISGHDPTGGAGIQADIETLVSMGCHPTTVITTLTVQDTRDVTGVTAVDSVLLIQQARAILEDMAVNAIKIGLPGNIETIEAIHSVLHDYPTLPVIFDPVMVSGGSDNPLADREMCQAIRELLIPQSFVLTPNILEARQLAPEADSIEACAQELMDTGAGHVLITGTHDNTKEVVNHYYSNMRLIERYTWPRLPHSYHGSGCTLASAVAGLLAQGLDPTSAIHEAQQYVWKTLHHGYRIGMGQLIPNRLFWANEEDEASLTPPDAAPKP